MELICNPTEPREAEPSKGTRKINFFVQKMGKMEQLSHCLQYSPVRLFHFEFFWIIKGSGWLMIDAEKVPIQENVIYCLSPGQVRRFIAGGILKGYYLAFSPDFYYSVLGKVDYFFWGGRSNIPRIAALVNPGEQIVRDLDVIMQLIMQEYNRNFFLKWEILSNLLRTFFFYLSTDTPHKDSVATFGNEEEITWRFIELVKSNFIKMKQVAEYAVRMNLSPNYLSYTVKKVSGFSASYYIQQCIVLEAKRRAIYSRTTMKETAYLLGFSDCAHFSKYFKTNCGISFSHYRKRLISDVAKSDETGE